jgi:hypothetical protein
MVKWEFGIEWTDWGAGGTEKKMCPHQIVLGSKNSDINS